MGKLKVKEGKHNHLLTNILKVLIFATIMLAPFFSILSRCLYVTFNKNAKDSYYGETINERQLTNIDGYTDMITNHDYEIIVNNSVINTTNDRFDIYINGDIDWNGTILSDIDYFTFYVDSSTIPYLFAHSTINGNTNYLNLNNISVNIGFNFDRITIQRDLGNNINNYFYSISFNKYSFLDNAFIYSVNELHNQQIFNWTENTAIYTTINTMTTGLGFNNNNNTLALLLTYWALNTAVYIIFDLVIWIFTKLTHILND